MNSVEDSITLLKALAKGRHQVSKTKLQLVQLEVEYLGRHLNGTNQFIATSQLKDIASAPKPTTVTEMLSFLGMVGTAISGFVIMQLKQLH